MKSTISLEQGFELDGYFAGDDNFKRVVLDCLQLNEIEELERDRFQSIKTLLIAMQDTKMEVDL